MDLSIVIVNYNVKHFLEQVLISVQNASKNLTVEVFVVDNNSVDGSNEMVEAKFPNVHLIKNKENVGFSKANNQAMRISKGKYILLLNPDTVLEEDTLDKTFHFMEAHPEAGACGVKMIDGAGNFHRESKRALPTPQVSFYKMIGLSALFPKSSKFGKYYMTHLSDDEIGEIEVLAGCYMFMRKEALDKVGLLDEDFFMYGEDIDLSYRIIKGGYKNYYFPETRIIHYKGESTKKKNFNYVKIFYTAMIIFFDKHFTSKKDRVFASIIKLAIYGRASIALLSTWLKSLKTPLIDGLLIYGGMYAITDYWEKNHRYIKGGEYPEEYLSFFVPIYILIWLTSMFYAGAYDKPARLTKILRGIFWGTIIITLTYSFLEESLRFSRALIALGAVWSAIAVISSRIIGNFIRHRSLGFLQDKSKRLIIVGGNDEIQRIQNLLQKMEVDINLIGYVSNDEVKDSNLLSLGKMHQLDECVQLYQINEIIFCAKDLSSQEIMNWITNLGPKIEYKIVPEDSYSIIGSHSSNHAGELYTIDIELDLALPEKRRSKRAFDLLISFGLILSFPIILFLVKQPFRMLSNIILVLLGKKSWVAYENRPESNLPKLKKGIIRPYKMQQNLDQNQMDRLHFLYAKDYSVWKDLEYVLNNLKYLGN